MLSKEAIADLYRNLIQIVVKNGVHIREDGCLPTDSRYQYLCNPQAQIRVYRQVQPSDEWVDHESNVERINLLIERSGWNLHEVIGVAHEYGHSRSEDKTIDHLYEKARQSRCLSSEEKDRVLKEENFAWREAKKVLEELGFNEWTTFSLQERTSIATYSAIPICRS